MKKLRSVVALLLVFVLLSSSFMAVQASGAMPIFDHCATCGLDFYISGGIGYVVVDYCANYTTFTNMRATVKIQKRYLGIFWTTVDIGWNDNLWVATSTEVSDYLELMTLIPDFGTYRAIFDIDFYGTTGTVDEIDHTLEWTYNA